MSARRGEHGDLGGVRFEGVPSVIAAAHELKSPLVLMRQLSIALEDRRLSKSERVRLLQQINVTSERALRLTNDLTKTARLQDAMFELEPVNPQQVCRDVIAELRPMFEAYGRSLRLVGRKHPLLLVANRDLLRRVIMNFSDNALNYAGVDGVVEIQVKALQAGKTIRVGVRDFGPALSSEMWRKLKESLASSPQPLSTRPQSSGLGLYIASQFAEAMNGQIGFTRHRNGVTFFVDLQASRQLSLV